MCQEVAALLDKRLGPGVTASEPGDGRVETKVLDHVHELGDDVHGRVFARDARSVARECALLPSSEVLVEDTLDHALRRSLGARLDGVGANAGVVAGDGRYPHLDDVASRASFEQEDLLPVEICPYEVADEPTAVRQLVDELFGGALHGYLTAGEMTSA